MSGVATLDIKFSSLPVPNPSRVSEGREALILSSPVSLLQQ